MIYPSPIGNLELAFDGGALVELRVAGRIDVQAGRSVWPPENDAVVRWLDTYFSGREPVAHPPLAPRGTLFQQRVWQELLTIPYGSTVTYGELARRLGCHSAQAVGQAVGRNPIAVIIPCHRVVSARGLGGYAYGSAVKQYLLHLENARLCAPKGGQNE